MCWKCGKEFVDPNLVLLVQGYVWSKACWITSFPEGKPLFSTPWGSGHFHLFLKPVSVVLRLCYVASRLAAVVPPVSHGAAYTHYSTCPLAPPSFYLFKNQYCWTDRGYNYILLQAALANPCSGGGSGGEASSWVTAQSCWMMRVRRFDQQDDGRGLVAKQNAKSMYFIIIWMLRENLITWMKEKGFVGSPGTCSSSSNSFLLFHHFHRQ